MDFCHGGIFEGGSSGGVRRRTSGCLDATARHHQNTPVTTTTTTVRQYRRPVDHPRTSAAAGFCWLGAALEERCSVSLASVMRPWLVASASVPTSERF